MTAPLRLGTRRSPLALAQSRLVADAVSAATGRPVELVEVSTAGDLSSQPLTVIGGTGVFVSALREAVLAGVVDFAVHSVKDLPVAPADGLTLAAVPEREDPRDVLVSRDGATLAALPPGAKVGTGSPRRACQLLAARADLDVVDVRGNVETRIAQVRQGRLDAVVLAAAGLRRLGRMVDAAEVLDEAVMLPAPGQGALAVECRHGSALAALLAVLDHAPTRTAVAAERALLGALESGCSAPVGALAVPDPAGDRPGLLRLRAAVGESSGRVLHGSITGPSSDPEGLGRRLAEQVLAEASDGALGVRVQ